METISISTAKKVVLGLLLIGFLSSVSADFYYNDVGNSGLSNNDYFSVPDYESQGEFFAEVIAPFLLITIVLQIGFQKALGFTLADNNSLEERLRGTKREKKKVKRQSIIMALIIAGMIVPTPAFELIKSVTAAAFGGVVLIFVLIVVWTFITIVREDNAAPYAE